MEQTGTARAHSFAGPLKLSLKLISGLSLAALISGCTVIEGGKASKEETKPQLTAEASAEAAPVPTAPPATGNIGNVASANIPIPLPAPRAQTAVQVASVDPSAGISALSAKPQLQQLVGVYADYGSALAAVSEGRLNTPSNVRRAIATLRFSRADDLAEGWFVAHATVASQAPAFAQGVRDEVRSRGKTAVLEALRSDDNYILQIRGARDATESVTVELRSQNARMAALSARFLETAYAFQKQKWGMSTPLPGTLPESKTADASESLMERAGGVLAALSPVNAAHAYRPSVMNRILTLAAYQVMDGSMDAGLVATRNPTGRCLNWARLNLDQCLAAARFPSEEAYCTGKHAVEEVRTCFADAVPSTALTAH